MAKNNSELKGVRKKLVAAIAMVLVACIMVVSSSYAWFTLSTAPEVKGIQTSVGANGNLEMALRTGLLTDIISTSKLVNMPEANNYWGNLVNLSDDSYHMDQLTLRPARLNITVDEENSDWETKDGVPVWTDGTKEYAADTPKEAAHTAVMEGEAQKTNNGVYVWIDSTDATGATTYAADEAYKKNAADQHSGYTAYKFASDGAYLQTPVYGTDGRLSGMDTTTVINGVYDDTAKGFIQKNGKYGVRAIGTISNMSPEELALLTAKKAVASAISNSETMAGNSLSKDAVKLAEIVVAYNLNKNTTFGSEELGEIKTAITNLQAIMGTLEDALKQAVVAVGVSQGKSFGVEDVSFKIPEGGSEIDIVVDGETLVWNGQEEVKDGDTVTTPAIASLATQKADLIAAWKKIDAENAVLEGALVKANAIDKTSGIIFEEISKPLYDLIKMDDIAIYEKNSSTPMSIEQLMAKGTAGAAMIMIKEPTIAFKGGVYCTIAEFRGDYTAKADLYVSGDFGGAVGPVNQNVTVYMATEATKPTPNGYHLPYVESWMAGLTPMKTGDSNQVITDIYGYALDFAFRTNAANSSLLLQTAAANRVEETSGSATQGAGSYMQFGSGHPDFTLYQVANLMQSIRVAFINDDGQIYGIAAPDVSMTDLGALADLPDETEYDLVDSQGHAYKLINAEIVGDEIKAPLNLYGFTVENGILKLSTTQRNDASITALQQNVATGVSTLVYLDGDTVENADVAISGNSMTGTMNLQFASSAKLDPMDYTFQDKLAAPTISIADGTNTLTITPAEGTTPEKYEIYIDGNPTGVEVTGGPYTLAGLPTQYAGKEVEISVVAKATGKADSVQSNVVEYTVPTL